METECHAMVLHYLIPTREFLFISKADIDECNSGLANCSQYSTCTNTAGSYFCTCDTGFTNVSGSCQGTNTCAAVLLHYANFRLQIYQSATTRIFAVVGTLAITLWVRSFVKVSTKTIYSIIFYLPKLYVVSDIDECNTMTDPCGSAEDCTNYPGSYNCACIPGYYRGSVGLCIGLKFLLSFLLD